MMLPRLTLEGSAVWLLTTAAFVFPVLAVVAPLGITVELSILGVGVLPFVIRTGAWRRLPRAAVALPAALVAWALASVIWAEAPSQAALASLRLAGIFLLGLSALAAGLAVSPTALRPLCIGLLAGCGLVVVPLLANGLASHLFTESLSSLTESHPVKRGMAVIVMLVWPLRMLLRPRSQKKITTIITIAILAVVILGHGSTARLAAAMGIATVLLIRRAPRRGVVVVRAILVAATLGMPLAAYFLPSPHYTFQNWTFLTPSAHHRLTIWNFAARHIAERPLLGWGMNASRDFPGGDDEVVVKRLNAEGQEIHELTEPLLPLHPHNALIQIWLELGLGGSLIFCAFIVWLLSRMGSVSEARRDDLVALLVVAFIMAASSFGFWQGWWQASLWLTATFALLASKAGRDEPDQAAAIGPAAPIPNSLEPNESPRP